VPDVRAALPVAAQSVRLTREGTGPGRVSFDVLPDPELWRESGAVKSMIGQVTIVSGAIVRDYLGAEVSWETRAHVGRVDGREVIRRPGFCVTVEWRGLQASREFAVT
jgi:hypothetical protein